MQQPISGFSKRSKADKIKWIVEQHFEDPKSAEALLTSYWHPDASIQEKHDEFIENTLSNFYLPNVHPMVHSHRTHNLWFQELD